MNEQLAKMLARTLSSYPDLSKQFTFTVSPSSGFASSEDVVVSEYSGEYRYLAFISYSHANEDWGKWIQKSLETFRVPSKLAGKSNEYGKTPEKVFPVFRDRDELSASAELSDSIQQALEDTRFLLVICSRESAKSHWVNQEIKLFKSFAGAKRVLCLIVDGEPHASDAEQECFPEAVKYEVTRNAELTNIPCEPMAADARSQGDGKFNAKLKLLAALLGVRYDDLRQREKVRLRRKQIFSSLLASILIAGVAVGFILYRQHSINEQNQQIAINLVDTLAAGSLSQALQTIDRMSVYRTWADRELLNRYASAEDGTPEKYRLGMGLLETNSAPLDYLRDHSLILDVREVAAVSEVLQPFSSQLASYYAAAVENESLPVEQRFIATCFLVNVSPEDPLWSQESLSEFITEQILSVNPTDIEPSKQLFHPKRELLIEPLMLAYGDESQSDIHRLFAKSYLLDYSQNSPEELFEALTLSSPQYFLDFFEALSSFKEQGIQLGLDNLIAELPVSESDAMVIRRQANIGLMLIKLGKQDSVWPVLQASPNPSVRTHLIHWMPMQDVSAELLFSQYETDTRADVRHSLLLALGEYAESQLPRQTRGRYSQVLLKDYVTENDSGLHSAIDWLLRQWGLSAEVEELDRHMAAEFHDDRGWYVNGQGQTFAIISGGTFQKGEPKWSSWTKEPTFDIEIDRVFAFGTKEVTRGEWSLFSAGRGDVWQSDEPAVLEMMASDVCTMKGITWYEAAQYCNWLSEREGIPQEQWCFEPNAEGKYAADMRAKDNFLELSGYRLPTDAEWEFACRAGTESLWFSGNIRRFIDQYGYRPSGTRSHPGGLLKPNGFGVFDLIGNGSNWVFDIDLPRHEQENTGQLLPIEVDTLKKMQSGQRILDRPIQQPLLDTTSRIFRGWSTENGFVFSFNSCHVNDRILDINLSIRLARTMKMLKTNL
jgi:formylglycine-generating enzyme required for sulfatase activity